MTQPIVIEVTASDAAAVVEAIGALGLGLNLGPEFACLNKVKWALQAALTDADL